MNYGPLVFLAAFLAMAVSWFGFVFKANVQLGSMQQTNALASSVAYPLARSGLAQQGLQVYRANGCAYCHSQQVQQSGTAFEAVLSAAGTNADAVQSVLVNLNPGITLPQAKQLLDSLPKAVLRGAEKLKVDAVVKALNTNGATAALWVVPTGTDIERGWGKRRTVAEDFLYDAPVMPGLQRIGPDLANVGSRLPDQHWHLRHLYAPAAEVKGSTMPPYRYLFETRKITRSRSPEALALPELFAPPSGYEIVPKQEAEALAAYLQSLKSDIPIFAAPLSVPNVAPAAGVSGTNAAPTATNAPAASAWLKGPPGLAPSPPSES